MMIGASGVKRRESIWELTISERMNASTFIKFTTVKPFVYCRHFFKCFFCHEHNYDCKKLLDHTATHEIPDQAKMLQEILIKGRRTVKVDISELKCRLCQIEFNDLDVIRRHLASEHRVIFTESGNGVVAYNLAMKNELFCCHICSKKFQTFILLNRHMNVHFSNFVCEVCGTGFMTRQRLIHHKEIHAPRGHPCEQCGKVYTTSSYLRFHKQKVHEGNRRLRKCPQCPECFTEHFKKIKHLKEVHGITFTFKCEVCNDNFSSRRALTTHTNRQHSVRTQCEVCNKRFSCVTALRVHMVSHSEERDFICNMCQKSYRHKKSLENHMKSHVKIEQLVESWKC